MATLLVAEKVTIMLCANPGKRAKTGVRGCISMGDPHPPGPGAKAFAGAEGSVSQAGCRVGRVAVSTLGMGACGGM
eukprot:1195105-Prorocentrum_minimum.AAC.3